MFIFKNIISSYLHHKLHCKTILVLSFILLSPNSVLSQINVDFSADETNVCSGSSLVFTDLSKGRIRSTAVYSWDFGEGASPATATGKGPHMVTYTGSGPSSVSLTITDEDETETEAREDYITKYETPEVSIEDAGPFCSGDESYQLTASPEGGIFSGTGVDEDGLFSPSSAEEGINTIVYTYTDVCSGAASIDIEVFRSPSAPVLSSDEVENDCPDQSVDLTELITSTTPGGGSVLYKITDDPEGTDAEDPSEAGEGTYYIFYVSEDGCYSTGSSVRVSINECAQPDLAITVVANPNIVEGPDNITLIVRITELRDISTTGLITVRIARNSGIELSGGYNNSLTSIGSTEVNNSSWNYQLGSSNHVFTSSSSIPAGTSSAFGLRIRMNLRNETGSYIIEAQIVAGSGNEEENNNNADSEKIDYFSNQD
jgi:PKD repeat protein